MGIGADADAGRDPEFVAVDRDGNIWTGLHSAGVNYFGRGSQRFEVFRHIPGDPHSLTLDFVNAIFEDRDGSLLLGTRGGLVRFRDGRAAVVAEERTGLSSGSVRLFALTMP